MTARPQWRVTMPTLCVGWQGVGEALAQMKPNDKLHWVRTCQGGGIMPGAGPAGGGATVAMLGDGLNDGPALAAADAGRWCGPWDDKDRTGKKGRSQLQHPITRAYHHRHRRRPCRGLGCVCVPRLNMPLSRAGIALGAQGTALAVQSASIILLSDNIARVPQAIRLSRAVTSVIFQSIVLAVLIKAAVALAVVLGRGALWMAVASDAASLLVVLANGSRPLCIAQALYQAA